MRIILKMQKKKKQKIENFQRYFQSLLHKATGVHGTNSPFRYNGNFYIPWSFSFPQSNKNEFQIVITTPIHDVFSKIVYYFSLSNEIVLGRETLKIIGMETFNFPAIKESKIIVKTLSPIIVYKNCDNDRVFLFPFNKNWNDFIKNNVISRLKAFNILQDEQDISFHIKALNSFPKKVVYKHPRGNSIYYGSFGEFEILGDLQYLPYIIDMGVGMGTSKGFGTVKLINKVL